jgi:hypothetical protein
MNAKTNSANRFLLLLVALLLPFAAVGVYYLAQQGRSEARNPGSPSAVAARPAAAVAEAAGQKEVQLPPAAAPKPRIETLDQLVGRFAEGSLEMVDEAWSLNGLTIDSFEMTEQESTAVQNALNSARTELMAAAQKHLAPDPERTTDKKQAFIMKPFPEEGAALRAKMMDGITEVLGAERGRQFSSAFPQQSFCGDFGNLEVRMNVTPHLIADKTGLVVSYQCFQPSDGSRWGSGHMGLSELEKSMGLILEME